MGSVYPRGTKLYVGFKDAGKWRYKSTGLAVGDEARAQQLLTQIEAQLAAEQRYAGGETSAGPLTLAAFAGQWLKDREAIGIREAGNDLGRLALLRHGSFDRAGHEELDHFASFGISRDLALASPIRS